MTTRTSSPAPMPHDDATRMAIARAEAGSWLDAIVEAVRFARRITNREV